MRLIARWTVRALVAIAALFLAAYLGDVVVYQLRGKPTSSVAVDRFLVVPLKGNKQEYDPLGTAQQSCSATLFPQGGLDACWHLRRNAVVYEKV